MNICAPTMKTIKIIALFLLIGTTTTHAECQNLIKNPGFEDYYKCPEHDLRNNIKNYSFIHDWTGNADYENTCGTFHHVPHGGSGHVSVCLFTDFQAYSGYIAGVIDTPLIQGNTYYFEMYVCLDSYFKYRWAIDAICISFSESNKPLDSIINVDIRNPMGKIISDTINWTKVSGYYQAKGNEKYVLIGNFCSRKQVNKSSELLYRSKIKRSILQSNKSFNNAIYLIDDVLLVAVEEEEVPDTMTP